MTPKSYNQKLTKEEFGIMKLTFRKTQGTIEEFAKQIEKPNAHSWGGGVFENDYINKNNWKGSQIIGLDFDKGTTTVEEVYQKFNEFEIVPNLFYYTFGDTPELRKFRIVFFFDHPIKVESLYTKIFGILERNFKIDSSTKDTSRVFYGGQNVQIKNPKPIPLKQFIECIDILQVAGDANLTRNILHDSEIHANFSNSVYYPNTECGFLAQNRSLSTSTSLKGGNKIDWKTASTEIKILDEFLKGTWLYHSQLFGLATNLMYFEGGLKKMKQVMDNFNSNGSTKYTPNSFAILPYVKKRKYYPVAIHNFSPYKEDSNLYNMVSELTNKRGQVEIIEEKKKLTLLEAEKSLQEKFKKITSEIENITLKKEDDITVEKKYPVTIIKVPTAIGKTELLTRVPKTILAAPTNSLKNELKGRMTVEYSYTPDKIEFKDTQLQKKITDLYRVGFPTKAMNIIRDMSDMRGGGLMVDYLAAIKYVTELEESCDITKSTLTTHKRMLNESKLQHPALIFDEDPIANLVEIHSTNLEDLWGFSSKCAGVRYILEDIEKRGDDIYDGLTFLFDKETLKEIGDISNIKSNVVDFFNCTYFIKEKNMIYYIMKKTLPTEKNNIIMSATISPYIYQKLYPETEFEILDIRNVQQKGQVIQYLGRSCSKYSMQRYGEIVAKEVGNTPVITHKKHQHLFQNPVENMYFGNTSGYDTIKGKDLAVVGTPHRPLYNYYLYAKLMDIDFDIHNSPMTYQKVEYNGYRFMFNTFDNKELQRIQLSLIESDLIQAVGRARTLRFDCTVELYSSLPLDISTEFRIKKI